MIEWNGMNMWRNGGRRTDCISNICKFIIISICITLNLRMDFIPLNQHVMKFRAICAQIITATQAYEMKEAVAVQMMSEIGCHID